jgi:hypothetical protein
LLLGVLLSGCTAKIAETDESGLTAHLTVDLHLPKQLDLNSKRGYSVEVSKNNRPLEHIEQLMQMESSQESSDHTHNEHH